MTDRVHLAARLEHALTILVATRRWTAILGQQLEPETVLVARVRGVLDRSGIAEALQLARFECRRFATALCAVRVRVLHQARDLAAAHPDRATLYHRRALEVVAEIKDVVNALDAAAAEPTTPETN